MYLLDIVNIDLNNTEIWSEHRRQFPVEKFLIQKDVDRLAVTEVNNQTLIGDPLGQIVCELGNAECSPGFLTGVAATSKVNVKVCIVKRWKRVALQSMMVVQVVRDNAGAKRDEDDQVQNFDNHCADVQW